jgi:hypothetical protein
MENQRRLDFFRDLVGRARILEHCYNSLVGLTDQYRSLQARLRALPPDRPTENVRSIPGQFVEEDERTLVAIDALISLVYYEITSVAGMLKQLSVGLNTVPEVRFLIKVRDRFFSHVQLGGVTRGQRGGWTLLSQGLLIRNVVALNAWSSEDLRDLGPKSLMIGSPEWHAQRRANAELVLSTKQNEHFTPTELLALRSAGVRECNLELALQQLGELLVDAATPQILAETARAIREFGFERWEE